jgi:hypothetical protein
VRFENVLAPNVPNAIKHDMQHVLNRNVAYFAGAIGTCLGSLEALAEALQAKGFESHSR